MATRTAVVGDATLERITHALVEAVHPARIILFGSRARGDARPDSDYDLAVELDFSDLLDCRHMLNNIVRSTGNGWKVDVHPRRIGQIEERRDDPGYIDWDIARDGIIVYPIGQDSEALRPVRWPRQVRERAHYESVKDWLARATEDLKDIRNNVAAGEFSSWSGVCFHAQQAAEKYVKVLYIENHIHPPRIHGLRELVDGLRAFGIAMPELQAECELLKDFAVDVRYPEHVAIPDEGKGRQVLEAAERIIGEVERLRAQE